MGNWLAALLVFVLVVGGIFLIKNSESPQTNPTTYLPDANSAEINSLAWKVINEYTGWEDFSVEQSTWAIDDSERVSLIVGVTHGEANELFLISISVDE